MECQLYAKPCTECLTPMGSLNPLYPTPYSKLVPLYCPISSNLVLGSFCHKDDFYFESIFWIQISLDFSAPWPSIFYSLKKNFIYLAALGLSWGMRGLVPWPGMEPRPPALGGWSLSPWTTRAVPIFYSNSVCISRLTWVCAGGGRRDWSPQLLHLWSFPLWFASPPLA